jgi:uncharacterized protein YoxC
MKKVDISMLLLAVAFTIGFLFLSRETNFLEQTLAKKTKEAEYWKKKCKHIDSAYKAGQPYNTIWFKHDSLQSPKMASAD